MVPVLDTKDNQTPEQIVKQLFDHTLGCFLVTDEDSQVLYANKALEYRTGFAVAEVVGNRPGKLWGSQMQRSFYDEMWTTIKKNGNAFTGSLLNKKKDNETFQDFLQIAPVVDKKTGERHFLHVHPDKSREEYIFQFQREFLQFMNQPDVSSTRFLQWLLPWIMSGSMRTINTNEIIDITRKMDKSLFSFLEDIFVSPTKLHFHSREDDQKLVQRAQENPVYFDQIYKKYHEPISQYFYFRTGENVQIAEDLTQETFYKALQYLEMFQPMNASYLTYLMRIAHNLLVNYYRRIQTLPLEGFENTFLVTPKEEKEDLWMMELVWKVAATLQENEQKVLHMKYKDELSVKEIADLLGKTENAVKLHLSRGRKNLKKRLEIK